MDKIKVKIFCDGSCKNVKGSKEKTGVGVFVEIEGENDGLWDLSKEGEKGTNNTAEWEALQESLKILKHLEETLEGEAEVEAEIFSDSQLVVNQFNDNWKINKEHIKPLYENSKSLLLSLKKETIVSLNWLSRKSNKDADKLSKIKKAA
jgi:ribonuclease HI